MITEQQREAFVLIAEAVIETVKEMPDGAPGGCLYAAMMHYGMSHDSFERMMSLIVLAGRLEKRGQCYYPKQPAT